MAWSMSKASKKLIEFLIDSLKTLGSVNFQIRQIFLFKVKSSMEMISGTSMAKVKLVKTSSTAALRTVSFFVLTTINR